METEVVDSERLKFFAPFQSLSPQQLEYIAINAQVRNVDAGQTILELESNSHDKYLLLEGSVKLLAFDEAETYIEANTERAKNPIAQLRPSRYKVTAYSKSKIIVLEDDFLDTAIEQAELANTYSINETVLDDEHEDDRILYELILELQQGNFELPSLPDIAVRVREVIEDEMSDAVDIANVVLTDPVIAAKIIKTANSALYKRRNQVEDCKTAVLTLGTKVTTQLVTAFTMKELFKTSNPMLINHMKNFWEHSIEIAAISFVLAKITPGIDAEKALLAGLIHDVGNVAILNKAINHPLIVDSETHLNTVIKKMHSQVSASILRRWNFSDIFIEVAEETEVWMRDKGEKPDIVDIVNMAHLHSYIGTNKQRRVPIIDQTPAFHKLAVGELTPRLSLKVLEKAHKKIEQTKALLKM